MCGLNGFTFSDPERLRAMHAATRHRGPDDEGFFEAPGISLAHNRLSIIDLSPAGRQPMATPDGRFTIVFNGEIYNYRELRRELEAKGDRFRSQSDTEVLLAAFARWGEASFPKLNGIFAFAIWDRQEERLTVVRDHVGIKPLYYHYDGTRLLFSSELKALLVHDIPREIDLDALNVYFRFLYVPGSMTLIRGINKLEPGSVLAFHRGAIAVRRWWSVQEGASVTDRNQAVEAIRQTTKDAIRRQLVSDRPLGVFLSGGIDSSAILGIMAEHATGPIKTFSVGYETSVQSERYNADALLAEQTARHFGAEHHAFTLTAEESIASLEKIAWHMDEPIANHVQSSTFLLAQHAKPHITVALGGDGGDELFGGYPRYWYSAMIDRARALPIPFRDAVLSLHPKLSTKPGLDRFLAFVMQKEEMVSRFLLPDVRRPDVSRAAFAPSFSSTWHDPTNQLMAADVQTWLPDESLARTDRLTMAHGLEERVPLLDPELVELAFRIPSKWKLGTKRQGKKIFIDAMRPYLPPHVLKEEKRAWMSPAAKWIRGPLLPFARDVLSPSFLAETNAYVDFSAVATILERHVDRRAYALPTLWSLLTFQLWYRAVFKSAAAAGRG
jgi:asparagine synthase (glutamine-hydrolysing)